jgi:hypothetical protein
MCARVHIDDKRERMRNCDCIYHKCMLATLLLSMLNA